MELSTKWKTQKIAENSVFATNKQKLSRKSLFLEYLDVKLIKNL